MMSKKERTIVKEEIVERFLEDIVGRSKVPWYTRVWWRFYWKYEVVAGWWRNKRQTWQTGFPHEQAWNFHSWHSETVVPRLKHLRNNLNGCPSEMFEKDYDHSTAYELPKAESELAMDRAMRNWEKTLDKMIWSFEHWDDTIDPIKPKDYDPRHKKTTYSDGSVGYEGLDDRDWDWTLCEKHNERVQEGLNLFSKYYLNLWD
jgi:hypothetical protein